MRNTQQLRDEMKEKISTIIEEKDMFKSPGDYALQRIEQGAHWTPSGLYDAEVRWTPSGLYDTEVSAKVEVEEDTSSARENRIVDSKKGILSMWVRLDDMEKDEFVTKEYVDQQVTLSEPNVINIVGGEGIFVSESDGGMITLSADPQWDQGGNIDFIAGDPDGEINFKTDKHTVTLTEIVALKGEISLLQEQVRTLLEKGVDRKSSHQFIIHSIDNPDFDRARSVVAL